MVLVRRWQAVQATDRCGAKWALVIGDQEVEQRIVRLKPLRADSAEQTFDFRLSQLCWRAFE